MVVFLANSTHWEMVADSRINLSTRARAASLRWARHAGSPQRDEHTRAATPRRASRTRAECTAATIGAL
eukprot:1505281-Prymnesium_polylepis.1